MGKEQEQWILPRVSLAVLPDMGLIAGKSSDEFPCLCAQEGVRVHRRERGQSFASRSIRLPETCDVDKIQADVENGVLEIFVPKIRETSKHRTIKVGKAANGQ